MANIQKITKYLKNKQTKKNTFYMFNQFLDIYSP